MNKYYAENILLCDGWATDQTITVENGIITNIETGKKVDAINLDGPVIPGMVNCHSHAFQRAFAGFSEQVAKTMTAFGLGEIQCTHSWRQ